MIETPTPPKARTSRVGMVLALVVTALVAGTVGHFIGGPPASPKASPRVTPNNGAALRAYINGEGGHTVEADGFRATFPDEPKRATSETGTTQKTQVVSYVDLAGPADFVVIVFHYPSAALVPSDLPATLRSIASQSGATVDSSIGGTVRGKRALTYSLHNGPVKTAGIYVVSGSDLYQVQTLTRRPALPGYRRFIASFSLKSA